MARFELKLPKMGESVAEATITSWLKEVGDTIEADEAVLEIATDKVDSEVSSEVQGILIEKLFNRDDLVQVGQTIAIIETERGLIVETATKDIFQEIKEDNEVAVETVQGAEIEEEVIQAVEKTVEIAKEKIKKIKKNSDSNYFYSPLVKNIAMAEGITQTELEDLKGSGKKGRVTKNDILEYVVNKGNQISITNVSTKNRVLQEVAQGEAELPVQDEEIKDFFQEKDKLESVISVQKEAIKEVFVQEISKLETVAVNHKEKDNIKTAPIQQIPEKEVPKKQISTAEISRTTAPFSVNGADEIIEMDRMGKMISHHMIQSVHTSAHVQSFIEVDVTNIWKWREKNKTAFEKREGEKLTFTPIFMEAVAKAIKDFPLINITVDGDYIIKKKNINLGMAASLPSGSLIVPVIKNADQLNLVGMAKAVNDLATRARTNKLKPDDIQGGTYTVTNVGTFGSIFGTPIINQPQVAILALGAIRKVPAVIETSEGDFIGIRHKMFLSHSYDHRVINGALGGEFIKRVSQYLEEFDSNRDF